MGQNEMEAEHFTSMVLEIYNGLWITPMMQALLHSYTVFGQNVSDIVGGFSIVMYKFRAVLAVSSFNLSCSTP